ncbi:juvenile hormone esterase-like isoform X2 [Battus philenor]
MIAAVNDFIDDLRGGRMTEAPIVRVEQGALQGRLVSNPPNRAFYSFQGIPYAKPPLGSLRFKAPQPPEPWDEVRDATSEGNVSAQIEPFFQKQFKGDENCLFLNVYTPTLDGELLPVMVHIHGGGFQFGSGSSAMYGGDYLVEKDVVVVTINYRLGPLGFLCLNTPEVPGNAGLKDIIQALRWVKQNIHNFGGNPGNLTISGESCGGVATSLLTASPLSKNLISKAIIQSGTALNSWAFQNHPLEKAKELAKSLGCDAEGVDEILEFLSTTPVKDIVEIYSTDYFKNFTEKGMNTFAPVIEKEFPGVEAALTESFIDLLVSGRVAQVPIMIGTTTLEFIYERESNDLQSYIPPQLNLKKDSSESLEVAEGIKKLYFKGNHTGEEGMLERQQLLSDILMNVDTHRYVQYLVKASNKPIYYYKFDYIGEFNFSHKLSEVQQKQHAGHMDDLGYLFKNDFQKDAKPSEQDIKMRERMLRLWTNFAKVGNPTPDKNHYLSVTWQPVTEENLYYLRLGKELSLETNPDKEKMEFWDQVYSKYFKIWDHPQINNVPTPTKVEIVDYVKHEVSQPVVVEETRVETIVQVVEQTQDVQTIVTQEPEPVSIPQPEPVAAPLVKPEPISQPAPPQQVQDTVDRAPQNGFKEHHVNGNVDQRKARTSNEIKMVQNSNGHPKDVIRANDPPEDDLPKNIGVNKFVNFFESLGGKK